MLNLSTINFPIILTFIRLVLSPTLVPIIFVYLLPFNIFSINILVGLFFAFLSLTDFFDGYLARQYNQVSNLGKLLDPVADKFLLYSTLLTLVYIHKIYFYWAILFIGREFFVMGLREIALLNGFRIAVSQSAKYKTAAQMVYLAIVIINPYNINQNYLNQSLNLINIVELILLMLALLLSLSSAYEYYMFLSQKLKT